MSTGADDAVVVIAMLFCELLGKEFRDSLDSPELPDVLLLILSSAFGGVSLLRFDTAEKTLKMDFPLLMLWSLDADDESTPDLISEYV